MPTYDSLEKMFLELNKNIAKTMKMEVSTVVKKVESMKVESEVYEKYRPDTPDGEPWQYKRRRANGGLSDPDNMISNVNIIGNNVDLSIENVTVGAQDSFQISDLVEEGDGFGGKEYEYKTNRDGTAEQYLRPRPFQQSTVDELAKTGEHVKALKLGLKAQGLDVL
jgi:hypothetical protein